MSERTVSARRRHVDGIIVDGSPVSVSESGNQTADPVARDMDRLIIPTAGRRTFLRPIHPSDYQFLFEVEMSPYLGARWRSGGRVQSFEHFAEAISQGMLTQFLVVPRADNRPLGVVGLYGVEPMQSYAYLMFAKFDPQAPAILLFEGLALFIEFAFQRWPFRKLYGETIHYNYSAFRSGAGRFFHEEGHLLQHEFYDGAYRDKYILALYRAEWEQNRDRIYRFMYESREPDAHRV